VISDHSGVYCSFPGKCYQSQSASYR